MLNSLRKLNVILTSGDYLRLFGLLGCVLVAAVLEVLGVFSVLPFMQVVTNPDTIESNEWLSGIKSRFQFSSDRSMMTWMGCGVLVIYAITAIANIINSWLISRTVWGVAHRICVRLLNRYARMPYEFFLMTNSAELVKKAVSDVQSLVSHVLMAGCQFVANVFKAIAILLFLLVVNPRLALLAFAIYGGAYLSIHLVRHRFLKRLGNERLESISAQFRSFTETLTGIKALRVGGGLEHFVERYENASFRYSKIHPWFLLSTIIPKQIIEMLAFGGIIAIVLFILLNDYSLVEVVPTLTVFAVASYKLLPALNAAFGQAANISHNLAVIDVVHEDMQEHSELLPRLEQFRAAKPVPLDDCIGFENATYRYNDESLDVLHDVSLQIKKGTRNAFVGSTGCGKSTLIDIMVGLLFPDSGSMVVDGQPINRENVFGWQKTIAYVPQDVFLYDESIAKNIALGVPPEEIDMERVRMAADLAQATGFIESDTSSGFESTIGEGGVCLSGGQRQRLGLARAFYAQPKVLFLDEATSALDNVTEKAVMDAIEQNLPDVTLVMIAHRLSTVKSCHQIFFLENGRLVDSGSYQQLVAQCPQFSRMVKAGDQTTESESAL